MQALRFWMALGFALASAGAAAAVSGTVTVGQWSRTDDTPPLGLAHQGGDNLTIDFDTESGSVTTNPDFDPIAFERGLVAGAGFLADRGPVREDGGHWSWRVEVASGETACDAGLTLSHEPTHAACLP